MSIHLDRDLFLCAFLSRLGHSAHRRLVNLVTAPPRLRLRPASRCSDGDRDRDRPPRPLLRREKKERVREGAKGSVAPPHHNRHRPWQTIRQRRRHLKRAVLVTVVLDVQIDRSIDWLLKYAFQKSSRPRPYSARSRCRYLVLTDANVLCRCSFPSIWICP